MRTLSLLLAACALALAGCGGGDDDTLTVSAASSLKTALTDYGAQFEDAKARFSFAGSDELAAQIRKGAKPDVFASANTKLPDELYDEGLVEKPGDVRGQPARARRARGVGRADRLAARRRARRARRWRSARRACPSAPTRAPCSSKLPESESSAILKNVRSEEPDVAGIVGKLTQGAVDAGFVYISDVRATDGKLKAIELPDVAAADRRLRRRGREGREERGRREGVRRRAARRRRQARAGRGGLRAAARAVRPFALVLGGSLAVALLFLTLPVAAIFLDTSPAELVEQPGGGGRARRAAAEPGLLDRGAGAGDPRSARRPRGCWRRAASAAGRW